MSTHRPNQHSRSEAGFALILALLALVVLTLLGLALATSTTTELQVATNYRWSEQARYNAEAGVEVAKSLLSGIRDWNAFLPAARPGKWAGSLGVDTPVSPVPPRTPPSTDEWGNPIRNFENAACDATGNGAGYGVVFDSGGTGMPLQYKTTFLGQDLNGAFTVWVRRPIMVDPATGRLYDYAADSDNLVLVSEGVAPFGGAAGSAFGRSRRAVKVIEVMLTGAAAERCLPGRVGQTGLGPEGANAADPCVPLGEGDAIMRAIAAGVGAGQAGQLGSGAAINPNQ